MDILSEKKMWRPVNLHTIQSKILNGYKIENAKC